MISFDEAVRLNRLNVRAGVDEQDAESLTDLLENPLDESSHEEGSPLNFRDKNLPPANYFLIDRYSFDWYACAGGKMNSREYEPEAWELDENDYM